MAEESNGVSAHWGDKSLVARGYAVYVLLALLAIVAANLYSGYRLEWTIVSAFERQSRLLEARGHEHDLIGKAQDRTSCLLAMSPDDRERFRRTFQPGAFTLVCPWVKE